MLRDACLLTLVFALGGCAAPAASRENCNLSAREVYERAAQSVVSISAVSINAARGAGRVQRGEGSGFIIDRNDKGVLIATNAHVVFTAQALLVTFQGGAQSPATVIGADPVFDVALIGVPAVQLPRVTPAELGDSESLAPGQSVIALGNPFGLFQTLTAGVVSAIDRVLPAIPFTLSEPYIQIDTPINPGNSGGPLLDLCARVVGVNSAVIPGANNIGFAIPVNLVKQVLPMLAREGRVLRPWIGFHGQFIDDSLTQLVKLPLTPGFLVEHVEGDSPAERAGLRGGRLALSVNGEEYLLGGDIIVAINGALASDHERVLRTVFEIEVDDNVTLSIFRGGERLTLTYRATERPLLPSDLAGLLGADGTGVAPREQAPP